MIVRFLFAALLIVDLSLCRIESHIKEEPLDMDVSPSRSVTSTADESLDGEMFEHNTSIVSGVTPKAEPDRTESPEPDRTESPVRYYQGESCDRPDVSYCRCNYSKRTILELPPDLGQTVP